MAVVLPESMCAAIPMFRTRERRSHSTGFRFSTILSWVKVDGSSLACSSLGLIISILLLPRHCGAKSLRAHTLEPPPSSICVAAVFAGFQSMCPSSSHWCMGCARRQWSRERIVQALLWPIEQNSEDCLWRAIAPGEETVPAS